MVDMSLTIAPKSDQLNADDLISGPLTVRITKVSANEGSAEQPISIFFEGDNGKPYKPCKSMRRVLVQVWGKDGSAYPGRSMTLYRDPKVQFGGLAVGGIRISHMSHIDHDVTMALTESKAKRKPFTVKPLGTVQQQDKPKNGNGGTTAQQPSKSAVTATVNRMIAAVQKCDMALALQALLGDGETVSRREWLREMMPDESLRLETAISEAQVKLEPTPTETPSEDWPVENAPENAA